jgi:hypothetical protein
MTKEKSYRFRLETELLELAHEKARERDMALAQVMRRFVRAWVAGKIKIPRWERVEEVDEE